MKKDMVRALKARKRARRGLAAAFCILWLRLPYGQPRPALFRPFLWASSNPSHP